LTVPGMDIHVPPYGFHRDSAYFPYINAERWILSTLTALDQPVPPPASIVQTAEAFHPILHGPCEQYGPRTLGAGSMYLLRLVAIVLKKNGSEKTKWRQEALENRLKIEMLIDARLP
ncbi:hypothetical protein FA95DRAFT_1578251, partial [Auriscalpium vulgare]